MAPAFLIFSALASMLSAAAAAAEPSADCQLLHAYDEAGLATFQFETSEYVRPELDTAEFQVGELRFVRQSVFEQPTNALQRLANRYHAITRETTIESALPLRTGDRATLRSLDEAERILRRKPYLYDVRILPYQLCGDTLDLDVVTRDVWTLTPDLRLDREGGENDLSLGLSDSNWFGTGKYLAASWQQDEDRSGFRASYFDPNLSRSRWTLFALGEDNDDGGRVAISVARPFYAYDVQRSYGASVDDFRRDEGLYYLSDELFEFEADSLYLDANTGFSRGLKKGAVNRWFAGVSRERDEFDFSPFNAGSVADRDYIYPYVAWQRIEDDFDKRLNVDRVYRTEDVNFGKRLGVRLGWSNDAWGAIGEHLVGRLSFADANRLGRRQLVNYDFSARGFYSLQDHRWEDLRGDLRVAYRFNHAERWQLYFATQLTAVKNLPVDKQLFAGGDTGLRGYPSRYQIGDRRFIFTLEERYYSDIYPFQMFRLGGVVFVDAGRSWYHEDAPSWVPDDDGSHLDTLANAGFGLRLESTRTRRDLVFHIDFGFPLRDGPNISTVEVSFSAKRTL